MNTKASFGLVLGIILFSLLVVPVCASDDNSWLRPDSLDDILAWMKTTSPQTWTLPDDATGTLPLPTPSYTPSEDTAWFTPASQEQIIAWGKMIGKQAVTTAYPSTLSQADRIRLFRSYNANGYVTPTVTETPLPTTQPVPTYADPVVYHKPITRPPTPYYIPSIIPTAFPTQVPTVPPYSDSFTTQKPITVPATPYYMPSTAYPTQVPTSGNEVYGQKTGVSLTELNLQGKYVKLSNTGTTPVIMTGWKITNSRGNALNFIDFPLGGGSTFTYVLNPYSTLTVYFGKEGMVSSTELYYPPGVDFWNPQRDTASLYDPQGQLAGRISA
jgi:hypothetical protein